MSIACLAWAVAGILVGQVVLALALALTRGTDPCCKDEHEDGV